MENDIIEKWMEGEAVEDWHDDAAKSIRAVYTGNSRTTAWRKKNEKKRLNDDAKRMKTLDNFFKNTEIRSSKTLYSLQSSPFPSPFPEITQNPLFSVDIFINV
ncbi:unnamed protein product [Rhizophagus irregularis]|nr:unnamed protein product [Rhizophagus irregularis]CAB5373149.1 unnamed protein product [Rhizophagus irregularis]